MNISNTKTQNSKKLLPTQAISDIIGKKIILLQGVVKKTILAVQKYKSLDIFGANEYNICTTNLETIFSSLKQILYPIQHNQNYDHHNVIMNETDRTIVGLLWHENIIDLIENTDKSLSVPFYLDVLNNMCFSDYIDRIIFQKQIWQLNEMSSLIKTFQSNKLFHSWKNKPKCNVSNDIRFTKVLTKYSTEYNNSMFIQNLCRETGLDIKDVLSLFLKLKKNHNEEEILAMFETFEITKLDISRIYRYIENFTQE